MMRTVRVCAAYLLLWLPFIALYGGVFYLQGDHRPFPRVVLSSALTLWPPMAVGVFSWWLSGRLPFRPGSAAWRLVLTHVLLATLFSALWSAWVGWLMRSAGGGQAGYFRQYILPWQALMGLFMYSLVTAVSYVVRGLARARDLVVAAERSERLRVQAELAALRAHINPHFLFNALHAATQLLRAEPSRAEEALERLSDLFRYVLRLDRQRADMVTVEDEWRFTESYLWLEQMRMGDRLVVDAVFDDEALACAVPPFTLQPLAENAVRHGLSPKREGGTLTVRGHADGTHLTLRVTDDGIGADGDAATHAGGVGVRAVRQQLEARFGAKSRTEFVTRPGAGFDVLLVMPAELLS